MVASWACLRSRWATFSRRPGPAAPFLDNPLQRIKRDVDVICGHVVFDYDTSRELAAALTLGMKVSRTAMV
jgi:3-hydroxy-9,10-secoandrosta-1,3,5(10)-triene-9,17-dione monooxygenase